MFKKGHLKRQRCVVTRKDGSIVQIQVLTTLSTCTLPKIATHENLDDVKRRRLVDVLNRTGGNQS